MNEKELLLRAVNRLSLTECRKIIRITKNKEAYVNHDRACCFIGKALINSIEKSISIDEIQSEAKNERAEKNAEMVTVQKGLDAVRAGAIKREVDLVDREEKIIKREKEMGETEKRIGNLKDVLEDIKVREENILRQSAIDKDRKELLDAREKRIVNRETRVQRLS